MGSQEAMGMQEIREQVREAVLRPGAEYGARNVRVFGSLACGTSGPDSDLDLLVGFDPGRRTVSESAP